MIALGENVRNKHEKLLIGIADEVWVCIKAFLPWFVDYFAPSIGHTLVKSRDFVEFYLLINQGLKSWRGLIAMVVVAVIMATMIMAVIIVVMVMRRHSCGCGADG